MSAEDRDPEIVAEERKSRILHIRLERYKEIAGAIGVILQTFKAEAISLVSGVGTLTVGFYQVRKWAIQGRHEVKLSGISEQVKSAQTQAAHPVVVPSKGGNSALLEGVLGVPETGIALEPVTGFSDPMNYFPAITLVVFVWSSLMAWNKRKKRNSGEVL